MDEEKLDKLLKKLRTQLINVDSLNIDEDYAIRLLKWYIECTNKNYYIHEAKNNKNKPDQETYTKARGNIFWTDLGMNVGSEFNDWHFSVVLKDSKYTALIAPLTSKKDNIPKWILDDDGVIDIGIVSGFPEENKECYVCTSFIRSVSKKRLSSYGNKKDGFIKIKLNNIQMDLIDKTISNKFKLPVDKDDVLC